jgi:hypothetical protein
MTMAARLRTEEKSKILFYCYAFYAFYAFYVFYAF